MTKIIMIEKPKKNCSKNVKKLSAIASILLFWARFYRLLKYWKCSKRYISLYTKFVYFQKFQKYKNKKFTLTKFNYCFLDEVLKIKILVQKIWMKLSKVLQIFCTRIFILRTWSKKQSYLEHVFKIIFTFLRSLLLNIILSLRYLIYLFYASLYCWKTLF